MVTEFSFLDELLVKHWFKNNFPSEIASKFQNELQRNSIFEIVFSFKCSFKTNMNMKM